MLLYSYLWRNVYKYKCLYLTVRCQWVLVPGPLFMCSSPDSDAVFLPSPIPLCLPLFLWCGATAAGWANMRPERP